MKITKRVKIQQYGKRGNIGNLQPLKGLSSTLAMPRVREERGGALPRAGPFPSHHRPLQPRPGTAPRGTGWNRGSAAAEPKPHRTPSIPARLRRPLHGQDNPVLLLLLPSHQPRLPPSLQLQRAARSPLVQSFSSGEYRGACV